MANVKRSKRRCLDLIIAVCASARVALLNAHVPCQHIELSVH